MRLALHACGAARLGDVATLDLGGVLDGSGGLPLPVRRGLASCRGEGDGADEGRSPVAPRRRLSGARLRRAVARPPRSWRASEAWPEEATLAGHLRRLRRPPRRAASASRDTRPARRPWPAWWRRSATELPDGFRLGRDEFLLAGATRARRGGGARSAAPAAACRCCR